MEFKTLNFQPIDEKLSSFRYSIPKGKKELMYDFYVLSGLPVWSLKTATKYARDADEMMFVAKDTLEKVTNYLQKDLLDAVFYAICCEFRHYYAFESPANTGRDKYWKFHSKFLSQAMARHANPYSKFPAAPEMVIKDESVYSWDEVLDADFFLKSQGRDDAMAIIRKIGISREKMVDIAYHVFTNPNIWYDGDYGGKKWAQICQGWKKLNSAKKMGDKVVYVDHVFDLQHNSDTVLNKSKDYADDNNSHAWIGDALDHKKHARSLFDLTDKCTPSLKYFAARVIKAATGETFEQYTKTIPAHNIMRSLGLA